MTRASLEWSIALRFLFSLKGQRFLFVLTVLGLVLVIGTVALTYTVVCVAESFSNNLRAKLLAARPHIDITLAQTVSADELHQLESDQRVDKMLPMVSGSALLRGSNGQEGVQVWGVDHPASLLASWSCTTLDNRPLELSGDLNGIILGTELLADFYAHIPSTLTVSLLYPLGDVDPFGNPVPVERSFTIAGACGSGVYPIDRKTVIISHSAARQLFGQADPEWTRLWVFLHNPFAVDRFLENWGPRLARWGSVATWKETNKMLLGALAFERAMVAAIIVLVFTLASVTLYGMLSLLTLEKRADFAVLYTLGLTESAFFKILLRMAAVLALSGAATGGIVGWAMVAYLSDPLPLPEAYYVSELIVSQHGVYWAIIVAASVGVQVFSSMLPGFWIRREWPVEALRFVEGGVV